MSNLTESTRPVEPPRRCPNCAYAAAPDDDTCPQCGQALAEPPSPPQTSLLGQVPARWPREQGGNTVFDAQKQVVVQVLPSGTCLLHPLEDTVILGRSLFPELDNVLDLTSVNAVRHGVSRHHCLLQRRGSQLVITDLGSTNGSYINGESLVPHHDYRVADGDRLILGTLHLILSFAPAG